MSDPIEISSVTLAVRDLGRVVGFYQDAIGLDTITTAPGSVWLGAGGRKLLHLLDRPYFLPGDPHTAGLFHTAFLLPTRADLGRWLRHATQHHLPIDGAADHLVSEAVYLADPEGNGVEVYADRPRTTWGWDDDQVVMANHRLDFTALELLDDRPWQGAPPGTTIGHVHLQVGSIEVAAPFYTDGLGLTMTRHWPQALFLSTGGYHHHVAINTWRSQGAGPRDPARAGLAAVTLRTPTAKPSRTDPWGTAFHFTDGDTP